MRAQLVAPGLGPFERPRYAFAGALTASALLHLALLAAMPGGSRESAPARHAAPLNVALQSEPARPEPAVQTQEATRFAVDERPARARERYVRALEKEPEEIVAAQPVPDSRTGDGTHRPPVERSARGHARERAQTEGALAEPPDPTYYAARQLDVFPQLVAPLELRYPERAREAGVEGRVLLLLHIDESGVVNDVAVVEAKPPGYFEDDAARALKSTRFTPGRRHGRLVKSRVLIELNYDAR